MNNEDNNPKLVGFVWHFVGLSTEEKPMPDSEIKDADKVSDGTIYECVDTGETYEFYKGAWYKKSNGGGGGGVSDYTQLTNLPQINGVTLTGDKTAEELGLDPYKHEDQIIGWTSITQGVESELDIRPQLEAGYTRFTIIVYIRKGNIRQGVKYELTASELAKISSKVKQNMVCITRSCLNPSGDNSMAQVKQCVTSVYENNQPVDGLMNIKYNLYDYTGASISGLDNFEWCMYAE